MILEYEKKTTNISDFPKNSAVFLALAKQIYTFEDIRTFKSVYKGDIILITLEEKIDSGKLNSGIYIISIFDFYSLKGSFNYFRKFFSKIEIFISKVFFSNMYKKLLNFGNQNATTPIFFGFVIKNILKFLTPKIIIATQVIRYGFAASVYKKCPSYIRPHGQDIYLFSNASPFLKILTQYIIDNTQGFILNSENAKSYLNNNFTIKDDFQFLLSDGIDTLPENISYNKTQIRLIRNNYNIKKDEYVIMNLRRFQVGWGINEITNSILENSPTLDSFKIILIEGDYNFGNKQYINSLKQSSAWSNIIYIEGSVSKEEYFDLIKISDVGISIMDSGDMRSDSIMLAATLGLPIIMNKNIEFLNLSKRGFHAFFIDELDRNDLFKLLLYLKNNPTIRRKYAENNEDFIKHLIKNNSSLKVLYKKILLGLN